MEYREHFVLYGHIITIQCLDFNRLGESQNGMTVFASPVSSVVKSQARAFYGKSMITKVKQFLQSRYCAALPLLSKIDHPAHGSIFFIVIPIVGFVYIMLLFLGIFFLKCSFHFSDRDIIHIFQFISIPCNGIDFLLVVRHEMRKALIESNRIKLIDICSLCFRGFYIREAVTDITWNSSCVKRF